MRVFTGLMVVAAKAAFYVVVLTWVAIGHAKAVSTHHPATDAKVPKADRQSPAGVSRPVVD